MTHQPLYTVVITLNGLDPEGEPMLPRTAHRGVVLTKARAEAESIVRCGYVDRFGDGLYDWYPPHRVDRVSVAPMVPVDES